MRPAGVVSSVTSLGTINNKKDSGSDGSKQRRQSATNSNNRNRNEETSKPQHSYLMGLDSMKKQHYYSNVKQNSNSISSNNNDNERNPKSDNVLRNTFIPTVRTNLFNRNITNESGMLKSDLGSPRHEVTPVVPNRSVSGGMETDDSFSQIGGSVDGTSKPSTIWYQSQYQISQVPDTKHVINSVCSNYLFPRVKFLNNRKDLVYSLEANSICQHFISQCNLASFVNKQEWWLKLVRW